MPPPDIIPFSWLPNWETPVQETLEWATDILQSNTGAEQRRSIRIAPRRVFTMAFLVYGKERQWLENALSRYGAKRWIFPIPTDGQVLTSNTAIAATHINCTTDNLDFDVGNNCLLYATPFLWEVVTITSIVGSGINLTLPLSSAWPKGTQLYPCRLAYLPEQPQMLRLSDDKSAFDASFFIDEPSDWPAVLPATTYRNFPVYADRPNEVQDLTHTMQRLLLQLDNGSAFPVRTDTAGRQFAVRQHQLLLENTADISTFKSLLYGLRGRQKPVWLPTHADDFSLLTTATSGSTTLTVGNTGYSRYANHRRDIRIELFNGTAIHCRILSATEIDSDSESLEIDTALPITLNPNAILRICFIQLCRLTTDAQSIVYSTNSIANAQLLFTEVLDDEL